jgi:preprotein translocase subunit SecE
VARDRKRAKQRRDRGRAPVARGAAAGGAGAPGAEPPVEPADLTDLDAPAEQGGLVRADVPAALDHASADVDEFDAALVRGAGGQPVDNDLAEQAFGEDQLQSPAGPPSGGGRGGAGGGRGAGGDGGAHPSGAPLRGGNRAVGFIKASWAELQRVQWPDRRQVTQATAVVLGFVAIAGAYLGLADLVAKEIVEFIL